MARDRLSTAPAADPVDAHVHALGAALHGPARLRASMLAEARDGLEDAAEALQERGSGRDDARGRAVAEFGTVAQVAPAYQAELAASQGRRTAALIAVTFPALVLGWDLMWSSGAMTLGPVTPAMVLFSRVEDTVSLAGAAVAVLTLVALRRGNPARALLAVTVVGVLTPVLCVAAAVGLAVYSGGSGAHVAGYLATALVLVVLGRSVHRAHRVLVRTRRAG